MATNTYVALQTVTLSSSQASIDFTSIGSGYTDLVIVGNMYATSNDVGAYIQFNGDTGSNYSCTAITSGAASPGTFRYANQTSMNVAGYNFGIGSSNSIYSPIQVSIQNYSNTTTYKSLLARSWVQNNAGSREVFAYAGLWRSTAAITSIKFILNTGSWAAGSTFTLYGIASESASAYATGGNLITSDANYYYHAFTSSGTFTPSRALTADVLVIAGGGSGGGSTGAGGGAGGLCWQSGRSLSSGTSYTTTIGAGGAYATGQGNNGSNSVFDTITANGGGGGNYGPFAAGNNGGSGGGGGEGVAAGSATQGNSGGATGYGNAGASGPNSSPYRHGGGGGAGGAGVSGSSTGDGGVGLSGATIAALNAIGAATGTGQLSGGNYYYAGGGGGGSNSTTASPGGLGGGGQGSGTNNANGTPNTGGGGGGGGSNGYSNGAGGSGLVVIRYAK